MLSKNQLRAIDALMQCPTIAAASRLSGLSERSLSRYLSSAEFTDALRQRQDEVITTTTAALVGLSGKAVEVLSALLDDPATPVHIKARVAIDVLRQIRDTIELDEVLARLAEIEKRREE